MIKFHVKYLNAVLLLTTLTCACQVTQLHTDLKDRDEYGQALITVNGEISAKVPVMVAALDEPRPGYPIRVWAHKYQEGSKNFELLLPAGNYFLVAFEDKDRDQQLDKNERAVVGAPLAVHAKSSSKLTVDLLETWHGAIDESTRVVDESLTVAGQRAALEDPVFTSMVAETGVWQPMSYLQRYPMGVYVLDEIDASRQPVVMIHGMSGYGQEFSSLIAELDHNKFQPWVFQYPSGLPLEVVSSSLADSLLAMRAQYQVPKAIVVAHAMGGLIARRTLALLQEREHGPIACLATVATPFAGSISAAQSIERSPFVVSSWKDLAAGSTFLAQLFERPAPSDVRLALFVEEKPSDKGSGFVPIKNQDRAEARQEAHEVHKIPWKRGQILTDAALRGPLLKFINTCTRERAPSQTADPQSQEL